MDSYGQFALVYDRLMADMPYEKWLQFANAAWERYGVTPQSIVDLGCGTGTIAIPLAKQGMQVTGIDLADAMLTIAREKEQDAGRMTGSVQWVCQDMRHWEVPEQVDAVISFCDCINYVTELEDVRSVFQQTAKQLRPGGMFMLDMHHVRQFEYYAQQQPFTLDEGDVAYIWHSEYDESRHEIEHQLAIFCEDPLSGKYNRIDETHIQRAYETDWIIGELLAAGFSHVDVYSDFGWEEPGPETARLFLIALKK
ncbi:class I SAM-dependent DNA methyltransferase [Paenibacillus taiwanensis]|uniref:class I SAM-dependent DNA methyltransferase n=1 Tax=Paenibacillus taiwanensis TaxID=401638 RepID=UPI0003FD1FB0|nr:class I SAM-dependent methyltransferase [Paenibacillus taiwanensis]